MANELINRCSKSLVIWEMHVKPTMRFHYKHIRMAIIKKKTSIPNADSDLEQVDLIFCGENA